MTLETTNPNCFTYKTDEFLIELLGGIRIDTLDRMRVTIKVTVVNRKHSEHLNNPELAGLSVRHNLDLYNDTQEQVYEDNANRSFLIYIDESKEQDERIMAYQPLPGLKPSSIQHNLV